MREKGDLSTMSKSYMSLQCAEQFKMNFNNRNYSYTDDKSVSGNKVVSTPARSNETAASRQVCRFEFKTSSRWLAFGLYVIRSCIIIMDDRKFLLGGALLHPSPLLATDVASLECLLKHESNP